MGKIAFLFSGQGAQYVGMGKEAADSFPSAALIFKRANEALGFDIEKICHEENDKINITEYTQPAILTTSIALLEVIKEKNIKPDAVAGLSLGEYSALVAAGTINFEDAVRLVNKRGKYMVEAVPTGMGTMAAIIGLSRDEVLEICEVASAKGICEPSNFNCPGQIVIGGEVEAVRYACKVATEKGARKAVELKVSGPFHTSMLTKASEKLAIELEKVEFNKLEVPLVANVTGDYLENEEEIKSLLEKQVTSSVYWEDSIVKLINDGFDTFIEIGPGKALSGFVKQTMKKLGVKVKVLNVEDGKSLEKTLEKLGE